MDPQYGTQFGQARSRRARPSADPAPFPILGWWYYVSAPLERPASANFGARERVRRGRLASLLILGILATGVAAMLTVVLVTPTVFYLSWTVPALLVGMACCLFAIPFNRAGYVLMTALLLVAAVDISVAGIVLSERSGLDPIFLSMYDLLVLNELIAVSLLPAASVFAVAAANAVLILLDVALQPHAMMWDQMIMSNDQTIVVLTRPIAIYFIVALVCYVLAENVVRALRRADRAEEIAMLEQREVERKRELEEGVQQLLAVHVRLANGDFTTRAPAVRNQALWQIATSLNNLIARLARFAQTASQAQFTLQRTEHDAQRLAQAIDATSSGQMAPWPAPSGTPLDPVIQALRTSAARNGAGVYWAPPGSPAPTSSPLSAPISSPLPAPFAAAPSGAPSPLWPAGGDPQPAFAYPASVSREGAPREQPQPGNGAELPDWLRQAR